MNVCVGEQEKVFFLLRCIPTDEAYSRRKHSYCIGSMCGLHESAEFICFHLCACWLLLH